MSKWADYAITGIMYSDNHISHVWICIDQGNNITLPSVKTKDEVISLLKAGKTVITAKWDYFSATWEKGAPVSYEKREGIEYLRTHPDYTKTDNLENMLRYSHFIR